MEATLSTREDIRRELAAALEELFEVAPDKVVPEARLYEDLDLDSIDAVDLLVRLQGLVGRRIHAEEFRSVRSVGDVVDCVEKLLVQPQPLENPVPPSGDA
jgi:acyl carrier protein